MIHFRWTVPLRVILEAVPCMKQIPPFCSCLLVQAEGNLVIDNNELGEKHIIYIVPYNLDSLPKMFHGM